MPEGRPTRALPARETAETRVAEVAERTAEQARAKAPKKVLTPEEEFDERLRTSGLPGMTDEVIADLRELFLKTKGKSLSAR